VQIFRHKRGGLKALKWLPDATKVSEWLYVSLKFSREFGGLVRVKSEFKGSKVPNSPENFEEKYQVIIKKVIITEEFRWPKVSF
jgi:hypothetical protein